MIIGFNTRPKDKGVTTSSSDKVKLHWLLLSEKEIQSEICNYKFQSMHKINYIITMLLLEVTMSSLFTSSRKTSSIKHHNYVGQKTHDNNPIDW